jgi:hypothetical protein
VLFNANIGQTQALQTLTVLEANSGVVFGQSDTNTGNGGKGPVTVVTTIGAIDLGVGSDVIGGTGIVLNGGASNLITLSTVTGDIRMNGPVDLETDVSLSSTAGNFIFTSSGTIDSQGAEHNDLLLSAGTGEIDFNANIGALTATSSLGKFTVTTAPGGVVFGQSLTNTGAGGEGPVSAVNIVGDININLAAVPHSSTGSIFVNNAVISSAGHNITMTAGSDGFSTAAGGSVIFGSQGQLQTSGGDIVITAIHSPNTGGAQGQIVMADGAILNSGTGTISLQATGDIDLAHITSSNSNAKVVSIVAKSDFGQIANSGNSAGQNIVARDIELIAANGIGNSSSLLTGASLIAVENTNSGNVQLINDVNGTLVIGTVGSTVGIQNFGGGNVFLQNNGAMFVDNNIVNNGGGNTTITNFTSTSASDITFNAKLYAFGGNGNILLMANRDLILNHTGSGADIVTTGGQSPSGSTTNPGSGQIKGVAGRSVGYGANYVIQTDQGWQNEISNITTLTPTLVNVSAPEILVDGTAFVTATFGDPGARDFRVIIDWHDGGKTPIPDQFEIKDITNPGTYTFTHHYFHFPNTEIQAAAIPISVTVMNDKNIQLFGMQQKPIVTEFQNAGVVGQMDVRALGNGYSSQSDNNIALNALIAIQNQLIATFNLDFVFANSAQPDGTPLFDGHQTSTYLTFANVPGNGIGLISIDSNIQVSVVHQSIAPNASNTPGGPPPQESQTQIEQQLTQNNDNTAAQQRIVVVAAIDENGIVLLDENGDPQQVVMDESILADIESFYETLKNGRYAISVKEPGAVKAQLLFEINLRGGKPAPDVEEGEKPNTVNISGDEAGDAGASLPVEADGDVSQVERIGGLELELDRISNGVFQTQPPIVTGLPPNDIEWLARPRYDRSANDTESQLQTNGSLAASVLGLGALAASIGADTWEERVDAALAATEDGALSKLGRLSRRLRSRRQQSQSSARRAEEE